MIAWKNIFKVLFIFILFFSSLSINNINAEDDYNSTDTINQVDEYENKELDDNDSTDLESNDFFSVDSNSNLEVDDSNHYHDDSDNSIHQESYALSNDSVDTENDLPLSQQNSNIEDLYELDSEANNVDLEDLYTVHQEEIASFSEELNEMLENISQSENNLDNVNLTDGYAYAVLKSNGDLVFFRSNKIYANETNSNFVDIYNNTYQGTIFSGFENVYYDDPLWKNYAGQIIKVMVAQNQTISPITLRNWFSECVNLTSFNKTGFNTENVTNMHWTFYNCSSLKTLDLNGLNTSNVTDISGMFSNCTSLETLKINQFDTSSMTDMAYMFYKCQSLKTIDLSNFTTPELTRMSYIFADCSSLTSINIKSFNTSSVNDMTSAFSNCTSLKNVTLGVDFINWINNAYLPHGIWRNTSNKTQKTEIELYNDYPNDSSKLAGTWRKLDITTISESEILLPIGRTKQLTATTDNENQTYKLRWSFYISSSQYSGKTIITVDDTGLVTAVGLGEVYVTVSSDYSTTARCKVTVSDAYTFIPKSGSIVYLLRSTKELKTRVLVNSRDIISTNLGNGYFYKINEETGSISIPSNITDIRFLDEIIPYSTKYWFRSLKSTNIGNYPNKIDLLNTTNVTNMSGMFKGCISLTSLNLKSLDTSKVTDMSYMFQECESLPTVNLNTFNTSKVTDMSYMFEECKSLTTLNLKKFDLSNVKYISYMFRNCKNLQTLDLSNANATNLTDVYLTFSGCEKLANLNLKNFNAQKVKNVSGMFSGLKSLTNLNIENFNSISATNMSNMFNNCISLKSINFTGFDTSSVTDMGNMFNGCSSLTSLDLSNFDTSNVTNMKSLFNGCSSLTSLDLSSFDTSKVTDMSLLFNGCSELKEIKLGESFTNWKNNAYLPEGKWVNIEKNLVKTEKQLYSGYPSHAKEWSGTWVRGIDCLMVNPREMSINVGQSRTLSTTLVTSDGSTKTLSWSSNNKSVATVDNNGTVTAVGPGNAVVTVATTDGSNLSATCTITVKQLVNSIALNKESLSLIVGNTETLIATILPTNATDKSLTWNSSNASSATVDSQGKVTAKKAGTAIITASTTDGSNLSATCEVTVIQPVTGISLNKNSLELIVGTSEKLLATIYPNDASNKKVIWSSSNNNIASVDSNGSVTAKSNGKVIITATSEDGSFYDTCEVTVKTLVSNISISSRELTI